MKEKWFQFIILFVSSVIVFSCVKSEKVWVETTQKDFANGTFDGGGNLYASWKGDVQVVNSWDLNSDGHLDITFSNYSTDTSYNIHSDIYWGSTDGFNLKNKIEFPTHACIAYNAADLNNDDFMDIIFGSWQSKEHDMNEYGPEGKLRFFGSFSLIYWGSIQGFDKSNFSEIYTYAPTGVSIADINNDGFLDIVFASSKEGETVIYWGTKEGYLKNKTTKIPTFRGMVASPVDLNKDGFLDIINTNLDVESFSRIFFGSKEGFSPKNTKDLETSFVRSVAVADLNNDTFLDIIFANGKDKKSFKTDSFIYWSSKQGYSKRRRTSLPTIFCMQPAVADLNKDGHLDIVFANCGDGKRFEEMRFDINSYIYYGSDDGLSINNRKEIPTCGAHSVAIADYDDNGEIDLLFSSLGDPEGKTTNYYSMLYYQKNGEFILSDVKFPTHNGHHNKNRDLGNIYDRKFRDPYVSSVFDAGEEVIWEKASWKANEPNDCSLVLEIRTGNTKIPDNNWSGWREVDKNKNITGVLKSRYIQYRAIFYYDGKGRPKLEEVKVVYR